jgi:hypothetical protein
MAQSRYGSAGELLAWRPGDRVGHDSDSDTRAIAGVDRGVTPGLWQGSAACKPYNENSDAILESASKRKTLKWHYSRPL